MTSVLSKELLPDLLQANWIHKLFTDNWTDLKQETFSPLFVLIFSKSNDK